MLTRNLTSTSESLPVRPLALRGRLDFWREWGPTFFAVIACWLMVLNQQRLEWSVNPVYSYGWAVPFLATYLFWQRWNTRPAAGPALSRGAFIMGVIVLLAAALPIRVIQEANPDWVKINWLQATLWAGLVLLTLARTGGRPYASHFIFPVLFCFTALPWPVWMEETLTQTLMRWNSAVSAEVLTLCGIPAVAQGNLVQVGLHWVNVEEACSGIRSLQTAFMMSLFLGELYRLSWPRRVVQLGAAFAAAFAVNLGRTILLTRFAQFDAVDRWHDLVGYIAMILCLVILWLLAEALQVRHAPAPPVASRLRAPFSLGAAIAAALWLCVVLGATEAWYRAHETALPPAVPWNFNWPRQAPGFAEGVLPERTKALLKFNEGTTAAWDTAAGDRLQIYSLQWKPGRVSRFLSSAHYPAVCLPAAGMRMVEETGVWHCRVGNLDLPFTTYLFEEGGRDVYVFHAVIEDRPARNGSRLSYRQVSSSERLGSVWRGERNLGQRVIGIALRGPFSSAEARREVAATLAPLIQPAHELPAAVARLSP